MSELVAVRKIVTIVEEIRHEFGPELSKPLLRGAALAVIKNPYAGGYVEEVQPLMEALKPLGLEMSKRLVKAMDVSPGDVEAYGKGTIVGEAGELEHGAVWHVPGGYAMRELLGDAKAIVPSSKKVGGMGTKIDIPIHHINAAYVRSHFSAMEVSVQDAPRAAELVLCLVMTTGPRPHHRMGGLAAADIAGEDGLR